MLKNCESSQTLTGPFQFNHDLKMVEEIELKPETTVNSIQFSDIVLKDSANREIKGVKHAPFVTGSFSTDFVNDVSNEIKVEILMLKNNIFTKNCNLSITIYSKICKVGLPAWQRSLVQPSKYLQGLWKS